MATASLPIESRPVPWRILFGTLAALAVAALVMYSLVVGFGSTTSSTHTSRPSVTSTHAGVTPDAIDRAVVTPPTATGLTPDTIDRASGSSSFDSDLYQCKAGQSC